MFWSNANEVLICEFVREQWLGILKTPCHPATFYVGYFARQAGNRYGKSWGVPLNNHTCYYYRTEDEALDALIKEMR